MLSKKTPGGAGSLPNQKSAKPSSILTYFDIQFGMMLKNKLLLLLTSTLLSACVATPMVTKPLPITEPKTEDMSAYANNPIDVTIENGTANFNDINGNAAYTLGTVTLSPGETKTVILTKTGKDFFHSTTPLLLRYEHGLLLLDSDNAQTASVFKLNPHWLSGKTYEHVNTPGVAGLRNATIVVGIEQG